MELLRRSVAFKRRLKSVALSRRRIKQPSRWRNSTILPLRWRVGRALASRQKFDREGAVHNRKSARGRCSHSLRLQPSRPTRPRAGARIRTCPNSSTSPTDYPKATAVQSPRPGDSARQLVKTVDFGNAVSKLTSTRPDAILTKAGLRTKATNSYPRSRRNRTEWA